MPIEFNHDSKPNFIKDLHVPLPITYATQQTTASHTILVAQWKRQKHHCTSNTEIFFIAETWNNRMIVQEKESRNLDSISELTETISFEIARTENQKHLSKERRHCRFFWQQEKCHLIRKIKGKFHWHPLRFALMTDTASRMRNNSEPLVFSMCILPTPQSTIVCPNTWWNEPKVTYS